MKRRWFQIHLSTAIVMLLAAAFLVWLNFRPRLGHLEPIFSSGFPVKTHIGEIEYGFPLTAATRDTEFYAIEVWAWITKGKESITDTTKGLNDNLNDCYDVMYFDKQGWAFALRRDPRSDWTFQYSWRNSSIGLNVLCNVGLTVFMAMFCEYLIRRREARKS
jgi:hypothetical protein